MLAGNWPPEGTTSSSRSRSPWTRNAETVSLPALTANSSRCAGRRRASPARRAYRIPCPERRSRRCRPWRRCRPGEAAVGAAVEDDDGCRSARWSGRTRGASVVLLESLWRRPESGAILRKLRASPGRRPQDRRRSALEAILPIASSFSGLDERAHAYPQNLYVTGPKRRKQKPRVSIFFP